MDNEKHCNKECPICSEKIPIRHFMGHLTACNVRHQEWCKEQWPQLRDDDYIPNPPATSAASTDG